MPPKGSSTIKLPEYVEQAENGDVRCSACHPPGSSGDRGWIKRRNLARHLETPSHQDSLLIYQTRQATATAAHFRQSNIVNLNARQAPASSSHHNSHSTEMLGIPNVFQHLDVNGIDRSDYSGVEFSAGGSGDALFRSDLGQASDINDGVLELDYFDEPDAENDEFAMPLPRQILESLDQEELDVESLQERFSGLKDRSNWAPYESKTMFLLDLLDNIPRLRLSAEHLKLIMWVMEEAGCLDVPKHYKLRQTQQQLRDVCGIRSHQYRSTRGNLFEMIDVPQLIGRDLSNPLVAPHLTFYPEDSGNTLSESWQAEKWKEQIPLEHLTPMYADGGKLYYVNELSRLHDGRLVIPRRWITRNGVLTADCWLVTQLAVPGSGQLRLHVSDESDVISVPCSAFASNYFDLVGHMDQELFMFTDESKSFQEKMPNPLRKLTDGSEELLSCFIKPWCDDVSGGKTKAYQPHNNIYVAHANIPGKLLNQEFFVRFVSTATHASSTEQFAALKQQLEANNRNPIRVYNAATGRFVRLRIYILNVPADNPAQSAVASHIGGGGNHSCRKCKVGGPYQVVETAAGYRSFFTPGEPRRVEDTVQMIWDQITTACLGVEDRVTEMQASSGIKDPTAQDLIIQLIERGRELKKQLKKPGEEVEDHVMIKEQTQWLQSQPPLPFNILFQIHGLDPHRDTPVEILHTILLGVEKYAWYLFHSSTKADAQKTFETRLQSSDILGLDVDPIRASYIMNFKNNLIGRNFKMLMQLTVFHVHDLVSPDLFSLIKAVGDLGAVLWYSEINDLQLYLTDLSVLVDNVLDAFAQLDPGRIITKMKLHLLTHLVEDIRNHGPAVRFSTEIFECYNAVFRMCSLLSNHQSPSHDIARKMLEMERFRHIVCGGFWETETGIECASVEVRRYFQTKVKLQAHLGWVTPPNIKPGHIELQNIKNRRELRWQDTKGSKSGIENSFFHDRHWYEAESVISASGDECKVGFWVVAMQNKKPIIGKVLEILLDSQSGTHGIVVLDRFDLAGERHPTLGMPVLVRSEAEGNHITVVSAYDIEFAPNVQHNCTSLRCPNSGVEIIRQERRNTTVQRQVVQHRNEAIYVVNMHALHNAQRLREVLPRHLTAPVPLHSPEERHAFLETEAQRLHERQSARREEMAKKRKAAREARENNNQGQASRRR